MVWLLGEEQPLTCNLCKTRDDTKTIGDHQSTLCASFGLTKCGMSLQYWICRKCDDFVDGRNGETTLNSGLKKCNLKPNLSLAELLCMRLASKQ